MFWFIYDGILGGKNMDLKSRLNEIKPQDIKEFINLLDENKQVVSVIKQK